MSKIVLMVLIGLDDNFALFSSVSNPNPDLDSGA